MKKVIIVGSGSHAAEITDYINHFNEAGPKEQIEVVGFIDDNEKNYHHYEFKKPFLGSIKNHEVNTEVKYLMGIANHEYRKKIIDLILDRGGQFTGFIHPTAIISPTATIDSTTVISHNVSVGPKVRIGAFNILNSRCTIGHDSVVGNLNFISPQVAMSGYTEIGDENLIGTNACTVPKIKIGNKNKIAAGMIVYKSVDDNNIVIFRHKERLVIRNKD